MVRKAGKLQRTGLLFRIWCWTAPPRDTDRAHWIQDATTNIAAESNFIFGDDFDAIMAILEENEELENDFYEAVEEVSIIKSNLAQN